MVYIILALRDYQVSRKSVRLNAVISLSEPRKGIFGFLSHLKHRFGSKKDDGGGG